MTEKQRQVSNDLIIEADRHEGAENILEWTRTMRKLAVIYPDSMPDRIVVHRAFYEKLLKGLAGSDIGGLPLTFRGIPVEAA